MKFNLLSHFSLAFLLWILLAEAVAQTPPPPPPPPPSTSGATAPSDIKAAVGKQGAITGRVLGEDGQPLAGVNVAVMRMSTDRSGSRTITTDEDGNFKANNLPAGAYTVTASVPGFVSAPGNAADGLLAGSTQRYRLGENVTITMIKGGAITGKVLDSAGQPLVGAPVWAIRLRDVDGRSVNEGQATGRPGMSDDRGVYRIYGLQTGFYVVYTSGAGEIFSTLSGSREVPTYYPNATRDTAQEVSVAAGLEVPGIDIRHRGDSGYAISGVVISTMDNNSSLDQSVIVELLHLSTGTRIAATNVNTRTGNSFGVYGVPEGEYELIAQQRAVNPSNRNEINTSASLPRRVTVRGGDVTGLELKLLALSSMAGRVTLEKTEKTNCSITRHGVLEEILLTPRREDKESRRGVFSSLPRDAVPDDKGDFVIRDLEAGRYRLAPQLPSDHWYVKAMILAGAAPAKLATTKITATSFAATGIAVKSGEKLSGVTIALAEGAAGLSGQLEGKKPASRMRVHLVPAEKEAADDVLRYAEIVTRDGSFSFSNLAPGKYWIVARTVPDDEADEKPAKPVAWDAAARAKLRTEAEAANNAVELTSCQRVKDFALHAGSLVK